MTSSETQITYTTYATTGSATQPYFIVPAMPIESGPEPSRPLEWLRRQVAEITELAVAP